MCRNKPGLNSEKDGNIICLDACSQLVNDLALLSLFFYSLTQLKKIGEMSLKNSIQPMAPTDFHDTMFNAGKLHRWEWQMNGS